MINITRYSKITESEKAMIRNLLFNKNTDKQGTFFGLMDSDFISNYNENGKRIYGETGINEIIYRKALVTSMLIFKMNIQLFLNTIVFQ